MKKIGILLLMIFIVGSFFSCDHTTGDQADTRDPEITQDWNEGEKTMKILIGKGKETQIVHEQIGDSTTYVRDFREAIQTKTGVEIGIFNAGKEELEAELLIGRVDTREESLKVWEQMPMFSCRVEWVGDKLVVAAYSDSLIKLALSKISNALVLTDNGDWALPSDFAYSKTVVESIGGIPGFSPENGRYENIYNSGENTWQASFSKVEDSEVEAYEAKLIASGYTLYTKNSIGENRFATYTNEKTEIHLLYYPALNERFRIIGAPLGDLPNVTEPVYDAVVTPILTQLARTGALQNAPGMSYVLQLADGSFLVIDGGPSDSSDMRSLLNFLKANKPASDAKPRVSWMFTHAHGDHMGLALDFLTANKTTIVLEAVYHNFPEFSSIDIPQESAGISASNTMVRTLKTLLHSAYPNAKSIRYHAGQKILLPDCAIEILLTHEDYYPKEFSWINHTSSAYRITVSGKVFTVLGDCEVGLCNQMATVYGKELKSDVLQVTHHGFNGASLALYKLIDPDICLWAVDQTRFETDARCTGEQKGYDFNAYLRNDPTIRHYHSSKSVTLLFPELTEK